MLNLEPYGFNFCCIGVLDSVVQRSKRKELDEQYIFGLLGAVNPNYETISVQVMGH